jgi:hypothetical protein
MMPNKRLMMKVALKVTGALVWWMGLQMGCLNNKNHSCSGRFFGLKCLKHT